MYVLENSFFKFHLTVKIDLVEEAYDLRHVFHLLYELGVTPVEALLTFSLIL